MPNDRNRVQERLAQYWSEATPENRARLVNFALAIYDQYLDENLRDGPFMEGLLSNDIYAFQQRLSELLMANWLWRGGFKLTASPKGHGPDFKAHKNGHSAWIELVSPGPVDLAREDVTLAATGEYRGARSAPHLQRMLRWTNALKTKLGQFQKYQTDGIVSPDDICVIAVNARMLDIYPFDIAGSSRLPLPVELGFGVGPLAIEINTKDARSANSQITYQPMISNRNGSPVDTHLFLDPDYSGVSAILGVLMHDYAAFDRPYPSAVAYNPLAKKKLPSLWLPGDEHWTAQVSEDHWAITRVR